MNTVPTALDDRFRAAAAAEGLLDVAYDVLESPVGDLFVGVSNRGLCVISYDTDAEHQAERLARGFGSRVLRSARPVEPTRRQLDEYFAGERTSFDLPINQHGTPFELRVWEALRQIPYGETRSYGFVARALGDPGAAQAVGAANGRNPLSIVVPCHRVIGADGRLVGYAGGVERKAFLLDLERRS